jgi:23S rRNA (cytidine1920-2'-O)/16S rRNA (cytidine1409-2'-O)-methyltransferase
MKRARLDVLLVERGLVESREKAQALIMAGQVTVDGQTASKAGQPVQPDASVAIIQAEPYVSRGGYKLAHALNEFDLSVEGRVAADIGASTGGFTDVLLQRGVQRVYAVDVGRGQLHSRLLADSRVISLERTNARWLESLPESVEFATVDVSFISLRLIVPTVNRLLQPGSSMIVLVKPQFEAGREEVGRGGVVRSAEVHRRVLQDFANWLPDVGLTLRGLVASPIRGPAGNAEFLAWLSATPGEQLPLEEMINRVLHDVHAVEQPESFDR